MKKILLALNAINPNESSINFGIYLAGKTRSKIIAVYLEEVEVLEMLSLHEPGDNYEAAILEKSIGQTDVSDDLIQKNIKFSSDKCTNENIEFGVHYNRGIVKEEIKKESRYADVIITDVSTSFSSENSDGIPSDFVQHLLSDAECPVIISPFEFEYINEIVFTHDGGESSVFAIKQFSYLFPELSHLKTTLIQIVPGNATEFTEKAKLKEWLNARYKKIHFELLHGDPEQTIFSKYLATKNKILVMGAYGRKMLFKHSTADLVLKTLDVPVFISHH